MRRLPFLLAPVAAAVAAAAVALPAGSDEPPGATEAIAAARDAFPALAAPVPGAPAAPRTLPTGDPDAIIVGSDVLTDGDVSRTLTLTDTGLACLTVGDTSTCQPADQAAAQGLYIAEVGCDPDATIVRGVVPDGVTAVAALGADEPATDEAAPDGSVTLAFGGDDLDGIELDDSKVASLALHASCDSPTAPPTG